MFIALTKLLDIAARSLFVLLVLYGLPGKESGQFGLTVTVLGLFAFVAGFERYIDVQRQSAGLNEAQVDRVILATLRFYVVNHALALPVLWVLLNRWVELTPAQALLLLAVGVGEHLCNEVYRFALMARWHRRLLVGVLAKNLVLLAVAAAVHLARPGALTLDLVIRVWAATSMLVILGLAGVCARMHARSPSSLDVPLAGVSHRRQYRLSTTHFATGLVAMAALQADRIIVGSLVSLEQTGVYFRHVLLMSFLYQVVGVASYNRIAPRAYEYVRSGRRDLASELVAREIRILIPLAAALGGLIWFIDLHGSLAAHALSDLQPTLLVVLLLAYTLRAIADYNGLLLNAGYRERDILVSQGACTGLSVLLSMLAIPRYGIAGAVCVLMVAAAAYLAMTSACLKHRTPREIAL